MKVTIRLRGTLKKYFGDDFERTVEVLQAAGLNYREIKNFGFVSINNKRVMIDDRLNDGDLLKAFSKVSGG